MRLLTGALTVGVFALVWRLSRPAEGLLLRAGLGAVVLAIGSNQWSERPLLFGLLGFGAAVLAADGGLEARWLVPIGWLWVNTHGSFPLGLVYLAVVLVGRWLDRAPADLEWRALCWLTGGVLLGAVNPLGPRLLLFPVELLQKQDVLRNVTEWQAPHFQSTTERLFLLLVVLAVIALVRRPTYRSGLVVAVFTAAALLGSRNIAVAALVLVPVLARAAPALGSLRTDQRTPLAQGLAAVGVVALVAIPIARIGEPDLRLDAYPTDAIEWIAAQEIDLQQVHMVAPDRVGNLVGLRFGPGERVFYDDRFDMFPEDVSRDVVRLIQGRPAVTEVLERYDVDLVLWPANQALVTILDAGEDWRPVGEADDDWALRCRRGADLGGLAGRC